ncbi:MAG: bacteriohemerythrin [Treponema sp.]|nr:bacteriohemerythrin [Treponema sp.]
MTQKPDSTIPQKELYEEDFISWNPKFNTGIPLIDEEHKKLVTLCNDFYKTLFPSQNGQAQSDEDWHDILAKALNDCIDYADSHFKDEEKLMRSAGFEGYAHHKAEHDAFREQITEIMMSYNKASIAEGIKFAKFLYNWVLSHIAHEDKLYIPKLIQYLKENSSENKKK